MRKINLNRFYLCYFLTRSYVWPLVRIVSMRRFWQVVKCRFWWRNRHYIHKNMLLILSPEYYTALVHDQSRAIALWSRVQAMVCLYDNNWELDIIFEETSLNISELILVTHPILPCYINPPPNVVNTQYKIILWNDWSGQVGQHITSKNDRWFEWMVTP